MKAYLSSLYLQQKRELRVPPTPSYLSTKDKIKEHLAAAF